MRSVEEKILEGFGDGWREDLRLEDVAISLQDMDAVVGGSLGVVLMVCDLPLLACDHFHLMVCTFPQCSPSLLLVIRQHLSKPAYLGAAFFKPLHLDPLFLRSEETKLYVRDLYIGSATSWRVEK